MYIDAWGEVGYVKGHMRNITLTRLIHMIVHSVWLWKAVGLFVLLCKCNNYNCLSNLYISDNIKFMVIKMEIDGVDVLYDIADQCYNCHHTILL